MIDRATHWFYAEHQVSASAAVENMRHDLWAYGFYNIWLTLKKREQSPSPEDGIDSSFGGTVLLREAVRLRARRATSHVPDDGRARHRE